MNFAWRHKTGTCVLQTDEPEIHLVEQRLEQGSRQIRSRFEAFSGPRIAACQNLVPLVPAPHKEEEEERPLPGMRVEPVPERRQIMSPAVIPE